MRVTLNLSIAPSPRERYALAWAVPAVLVASAVLLFFVFSAVRNVRTSRSVHRSQAELQTRERQLRDRETALRRNLDQPQFRHVFREAEFVNGLIEERQFSLTELTVKVAKLLPPSVRLTGLALSRESGESILRFAVTGRNEEAVESFLSNLEDSPDFGDVTIRNQGLEEEGAGKGQVTLTCTARYLGWKGD